MFNISDIYIFIFSVISGQAKVLLSKVMAYVVKRIRIEELNNQLQIEW